MARISDECINWQFRNWVVVQVDTTLEWPQRQLAATTFLTGSSRDCEVFEAFRKSTFFKSCLHKDADDGMGYPSR